MDEDQKKKETVRRKYFHDAYCSYQRVDVLLAFMWERMTPCYLSPSSLSPPPFSPYSLIVGFRNITLFPQATGFTRGRHYLWQYTTSTTRQRSGTTRKTSSRVDGRWLTAAAKRAPVSHFWAFRREIGAALVSHWLAQR